jgi:hypothetical protein
MLYLFPKMWSRLKDVLKGYCEIAPFGDLLNERNVIDLNVRKSYEYNPGERTEHDFFSVRWHCV